MSTTPNAPEIAVDSRDGAVLVRLSGVWTTHHLQGLQRQIAKKHWPRKSPVRLLASGITKMDTGGALLFQRVVSDLETVSKEVKVEGLPAEYERLVDLLRGRLAKFGEPKAPSKPFFLERLGRGAISRLTEVNELLSFTGATVLAILGAIRRPHHFRFRALLKIVETSGVHAIGIVGLLSFLLGIVIAYQGGVQLKNYGANIFIVELVTLTMVRELAPLIAAIVVSGRTASAYAAEIGTMKVTEEIDAMRTLGIDPVDVLVLPKLLGLVVALPLLTLFATVLGTFGGMVMAHNVLDVSYFDFYQRIPDAISFSSFAVGIGKTPFFAAIIAMVGCYQGFKVKQGAESVGLQTTIAVVQSIFLVIVADAVFSVLFSMLDV